MRFPISNSPFPKVDRLAPRGNDGSQRELFYHNRQSAIGNASAFTMMEVAICLAIIGFALVAIIGVLPYGLNTQRDNREETIVNQDATVFLEAIRNPARGADYLTNYVYAITNFWREFDDKGQPTANSNSWGYAYNAAYNNQYLTNGSRIIGLLSTPQFTSGSTPGASIPGGNPMVQTFGQNYVSNHVVAYVRAISGVAAEKPPQDNSIMQENAFTYQLYVVNAAMPTDTNSYNQSRFAQQIGANQRELRLTFTWPLLPSGGVGAGRQIYRTTIAGQLSPTNMYGDSYYFYQPQSFTFNAAP